MTTYAHVTTNSRNYLRADSTCTVGDQTVTVPEKVTDKNGEPSSLWFDRLAVTLHQLGFEQIRGDVLGDETHVKLPVRSLLTGE